MQDTIISLLVKPYNLLFLFNAFLLFFVVTVPWNSLVTVYPKRMFLNLFKTEAYNLLFLKTLSFILILIFILFAEYQWSLLTQTNFFPLIQSSFVRYNLFGFILSLIIQFLVRSYNKKPKTESLEMILFIITYLSVLYLFFLIVFIATITTRLNVFPDDFLKNYSPTNAERINQIVLCVLYFIHLILVFWAISVKNTQRVILLIVYTVLLALIHAKVMLMKPKPLFNPNRYNMGQTEYFHSHQ